MRRRFFALDYMNQALHFIDEAKPSTNWSVPVGGSLRDMQLAGDGRLLVTRDDGWAFHSVADGALLERVVAEGLSGLAALRLLPDGSFYGGVNRDGAMELWRFDGSGRVLERVRLPEFKHVRQLRRTPEGTWLATHYEGGIEFAVERGEVEILKRLSQPGMRYAYLLLRDAEGNYLLSGGYSMKTCVFAPDGALLREITLPQPEGKVNYYNSGFQLLDDGGLVQANWNGHGERDYHDGLQLFEFDKAGKLVWSWGAPRSHVGSIINFIILDGSGAGASQALR